MVVQLAASSSSRLLRFVQFPTFLRDWQRLRLVHEGVRTCSRLSPSPPIRRRTPFDFANRWVDRLESFVEGRMHALDIPEHQIGSSGHKHGVPRRTFFPLEGSDVGGEGGSRAVAAC